MATQAELNQLETRLRSLASQAQTCEGVALALIEVGGVQSLTGLLRPRDYDRARAAMIKASSQIVRNVASMRRTTLSSHLIRAQHQVVQMRTHCRNCRELNQVRLLKGQSFQCLLNAQAEQQESLFHFELDEKGDIVERT